MNDASAKFVASMWDDALLTDLRLIEILNKYGLTACFAISPGRHQNHKILNDPRGNYGELVTLTELKEFKNFEICNHTFSHVNLVKESRENVLKEIIDGQVMLEDIFERKITGFCYPYGEFNDMTIKCLRELEYHYARTTKFEQSSNLALAVTCRWNDPNLFTYLKQNKKTIFWGHSYEFKNEADWERIDNIYKYISESGSKVIKFEEIINV